MTYRLHHLGVNIILNLFHFTYFMTITRKFYKELVRMKNCGNIRNDNNSIASTHNVIFEMGRLRECICQTLAPSPLFTNEGIFSKLKRIHCSFFIQCNSKIGSFQIWSHRKECHITHTTLVADAFRNAATIKQHFSEPTCLRSRSHDFYKRNTNFDTLP